jgi:hypothetical protein
MNNFFKQQFISLRNGVARSLLRLLLFYFIFGTCAISSTFAQKTTKYNLSGLLANNKLFINPRSNVTAFTDDSRQAVSVTGIAWLKGVNFSTGSIDVDLRGKNVFQQSFLGIAFHGVDSTTYDAVYFRPFNFQSPDTLRQKHEVQYISEPDYPWDRLRKEHPLVYENEVNPVPLATNWFHAHIVVTKEEVAVYVNYSAKPSLTVKKLNTRDNGFIGLWDYGLGGAFANLQITPQPPKGGVF